MIVFKKIFFAALALITLALPTTTSCWAETGTQRYRIGAVLPLSGDAAALGKASQNGMIMAHESLPPKDHERIELKFEDDALAPSRSVAAFRKLVDVDRVNAVICWSSGTCKVLAPLAEMAKIPLVAIASDAAVSRGRDFAVNFWVTPEEESRILLDEALRRGYRRIAIVSAIQEGVQACRDAFKLQNQERVKILIDQELPADMKDFKATVTRIASLPDLDAVLVILMPGQIGTFTKQLRQLGSHAAFFGYESFEDKGELESSGGALIGAWFATASTGDTKFVSKYWEKFPNEVIVTANNGFDAVQLLSTASQSSRSGEDVAKYLRTVRDFAGASGTFSATGDNRFSLAATLKVVLKDGFKELKDGGV